jgi:hypothetical protein
MKDIRPHEGAGDPEFRFNWNSAFAQSSTDPTVMYLGAQFLFRSRDRGDTWDRISGDLTTNDPAKLKQKQSGGLTPDNTSAENYCTIITIAESPLEAGVIWAGTDDGNVQITRDNGRSWTNVVKNIPGLPANTWVSMIEAGRHAPGVAFATFDGHRAGDMATHVFTTADYGRTWKSIANGLEGFAHAVRQDLVKPDLLFAGTEFGLFVSIDRGASWSRMTGLPQVAVHDLAIHPRERDLVIATHGRGMQILDDITPLRSLDAATLGKTLAVLPSRPAYQSVPAPGWRVCQLLPQVTAHFRDPEGRDSRLRRQGDRNASRRHSPGYQPRVLDDAPARAEERCGAGSWRPRARRAYGPRRQVHGSRHSW